MRYDRLFALEKEFQFLGKFNLGTNDAVRICCVNLHFLLSVRGLRDLRSIGLPEILIYAAFDDHVRSELLNEVHEMIIPIKDKPEEPPQFQPQQKNLGQTLIDKNIDPQYIVVVVHFDHYRQIYIYKMKDWKKMFEEHQQFVNC